MYERGVNFLLLSDYLLTFALRPCFLSNAEEVYSVKPLTSGGVSGINSMISFSDCKLEV